MVATSLRSMDGGPARAGAVVGTGAVLGYWMFALAGALLFAGVGLAIALVFGLAGQRTRPLAAALGLLLAGAALYSSSTLGWGAADAPDGTRYKVSPVGLSHVLTPHQTVSRTIDCGWYRVSRHPARCEVGPGGASAFVRLHAVYPLLLLGIACCAIGALGSMRLARLQRAQGLLAAAGAGAAGLSVVVFATSFGQALAPLATLSVGTGGTLGTMQLTAAILLCLGAALWARPAGRGDEVLA